MQFNFFIGSFIMLCFCYTSAKLIRFDDFTHKDGKLKLHKYLEQRTINGKTIHYRPISDERRIEMLQKIYYRFYRKLLKKMNDQSARRNIYIHNHKEHIFDPTNRRKYHKEKGPPGWWGK